MPQFRYQATDRQGRVEQGAIDAPNANEAIQALARRGLSVSSVGLASPTPAASTRPSTPAPSANPPHAAAPTASGAVFRALVSYPSGEVREVPVTAPTMASAIRELTAQHLVLLELRRGDVMLTHHTAPSSEKRRYFLFVQVAEQLRAGIAPRSVFESMAQTFPNEDMRKACAAISAAVAEGGRISDAMALWPDLFLPPVIGMVRSGEEAGFLAEAFQSLADQADQAARFKRWFWWLWIVAVNAFLGIPAALLASRSFLLTWDRIEKTGGQGGPAEAFRAMMGSIGQQLLWPILPLVIALFGLMFGLRFQLSKSKAMAFRHRLGAVAFPFGSRARHEGTTVFAWTLAKLSEAGISPARAWWLAATSVPNIEIGRRLLVVGAAMNEGTKLSEAIGRSQLFPREALSLVTTGEMVGDVPNQLVRLSSFSRDQFNQAAAYAKMRSGCWGFLALGVTGGVMLIIITWMWYSEFPKRVLKGLEPEIIAPRTIQ